MHFNPSDVVLSALSESPPLDWTYVLPMDTNL